MFFTYRKRYLRLDHTCDIETQDMTQLYLAIPISAKLSNMEPEQLPTQVVFNCLIPRQLKHQKKCQICLKLTIKTPERYLLLSLNVFIINFVQISPIFLVLPLLTWNK